MILSPPVQRPVAVLSGPDRTVDSSSLTCAVCCEGQNGIAKLVRRCAY
jgi:hypothetical protein